MAAPVSIRVIAEDFDVGAEVAALHAGRTDIGAVVSFTGLCRDDGKLSALELEHYPGMAEAELARVAEEALTRWPDIQGIRIIHRYGKIEPGAQIVLVVTASPHRASAFQCADFLMDFLKTRAPFWKKEHLADGTSAGWVAAKDSDDTRADRWKS